MNCPFCAEPMNYTAPNTTGYSCGTTINTSGHSRDRQAKGCAQRERQRLHAQLARLNVIADAAELLAEVAASPWESHETKGERLHHLKTALGERRKEIVL